jgi:hypothetical protein
LLCFECLNVCKAIDDPASYPEVAGAVAKPTPLFEGSRADMPAVGEFILVQVAHYGAVISWYRDFCGVLLDWHCRSSYVIAEDAVVLSNAVAVEVVK